MSKRLTLLAVVDFSMGAAGVFVGQLPSFKAATVAQEQRQDSE
jgi:hypothetical protein